MSGFRRTQTSRCVSSLGKRGRNETAEELDHLLHSTRDGDRGTVDAGGWSVSGGRHRVRGLPFTLGDPNVRAEHPLQVLELAVDTSLGGHLGVVVVAAVDRYSGYLLSIAGLHLTEDGRIVEVDAVGDGDHAPFLRFASSKEEAIALEREFGDDGSLGEWMNFWDDSMAVNEVLEYAYRAALREMEVKREPFRRIPQEPDCVCVVDASYWMEVPMPRSRGMSWGKGMEVEEEEEEEGEEMELLPPACAAFFWWLRSRFALRRLGKEDVTPVVPEYDARRVRMGDGSADLVRNRRELGALALVNQVRAPQWNVSCKLPAASKVGGGHAGPFVDPQSRATWLTSSPLSGCGNGSWLGSALVRLISSREHVAKRPVYGISSVASSFSTRSPHAAAAQGELEDTRTTRQPSPATSFHRHGPFAPMDQDDDDEEEDDEEGRIAMTTFGPSASHLSAAFPRTTPMSSMSWNE